MSAHAPDFRPRAASVVVRRTASRAGLGLTGAARRWASLVLCAGALAACTPPQPTPYQPLPAEARSLGGYEETRLQGDVYRVSFRGNRYSPEEDVVDKLYLRCAELTLAAGYSHFEVTESFGSFQYRLIARYEGGRTMMIIPRASAPLSVHVWPSGVREPVYVTEPGTRVAMFVIRMRNDAGPAEGEPVRFDARDMAERLAAKKLPPPTASE